MWPSAAFSPYPPQPHTRRQMQLPTRSCPPLPASRMCGWNSTCSSSSSSRWQRPHSVGRANIGYCQLWMLPQAPQCSPRHSSLHHSSSSRCFHQGLQPPAHRCPLTPPTPLGCHSRHLHNARSTQARRGGAHSWRVTTTERGLPAGSAQKPQQGAGVVMVPTPKTHKESSPRGATRGWDQGVMEQGWALGRAPPLWGRQASPQGARAGAQGGAVPPNAHLPWAAQRACPCSTLKAR